jgi:hypothetical protein
MPPVSSKYATVIAGAVPCGTTLSRIFTGAVELPSLTDVAPPECYGFPPALLPFWSVGSGPGYVGLWKHWFSEREPSFVEMWIEDGFRVSEIARSCEQFYIWVCLRCTVDADGVSEKVRRLADELRGVDLEAIDRVSLADEVNSALRTEFAAFRRCVPLRHLPAATLYDGEFPWEERASPSLTSWSTDRVSPFECSKDLWSKLLASVGSPSWFAERPVDGFSAALVRGDSAAAWMAINQPGWDFADAADALRTLSRKVDDRAFDSLVEAWCSSHESIEGGY